MRTQSEPPGPSVDGGEHQSLPSSPTNSAVTAFSGRSSLGKGLQYRGAWCTPPRIFMDHQDEIIRHLDSGQLSSTVDPDTIQTDKGKRVTQRPIRISAWKLAKLDSTEAHKAGAKARASSSVLRPVGSKPHHYDTDYNSTTMSGKTSPVSTRHGYYETTPRAGTSSRLSPNKSSYPPSQASRDETDTCAHSVSNLSSPLAMNLSPSTFCPNSSNLDHINPAHQFSMAQLPPISAAPSMPLALDTVAHLPARKGNLGSVENAKSSVYWDPEAGWFVSASTRSVGSSSHAPQSSASELTYASQSIVFGGPLLNEHINRGTRPTVPIVAGTQRNSNSSYYQQGRSQRGGQLPVFVPSDSQQQNTRSE